MTQEANEASVQGDFEDARFVYGGIEARMQRTSAGGYTMSFHGPEGELQRVEVVRTVGSHRYQQYLGREGDLFVRLPMAWHVEEGRWCPNPAAVPPEPPATLPATTTATLPAATKAPATVTACFKSTVGIFQTCVMCESC